ncbi:hypothetical protein ES708_13364 [subsurface metagenome]
MLIDQIKYALITKDNKTFFANESVRLWFEEENHKQVLVVHWRDINSQIKSYKTKE